MVCRTARILPKETQTMAFKLTRTELKTKAELVAKLTEAGTALQTAVEEANSAIEQLLTPLNDAVTAYNEVLLEGAEFCTVIKDRLDTEYDNKSENWQDSDKGTVASEFKEKWAELGWEAVPEYELEDFEIPEDIEELKANFEELPDEPE